MGIRSRVDFIIPPRRAVWQRRKGDLRLYRLIRILPAAIYALIRVGNAVETGRTCRPNTLDRYISVAICRLGAKRHLILDRVLGVEVNAQRGLSVNVIDRPRRAADSDALSSGAAPAAAAVHELTAHALQDIAGVDAELHVRSVYVFVSVWHDNVAVFIFDFANSGSRSSGREAAQIGIILRSDVFIVEIHFDVYLVGVLAPRCGVSHILRDRHLVQLLIRVSLTVQRRLPPSKGVARVLRRAVECRRVVTGDNFALLVSEHHIIFNAVGVRHRNEPLLKVFNGDAPVQVPAQSIAWHLAVIRRAARRVQRVPFHVVQRKGFVGRVTYYIVDINGTAVIIIYIGSGRVSIGSRQLAAAHLADGEVPVLVERRQAPLTDFLKLSLAQRIAVLINDLHIHINILLRLAHRRRHPDARHGEGHARALPMLARDGQIGLPIERVIARLLPLKGVRIDRDGVSFLISIRGNGFSVRARRLRFCSIMERPVEAICRAVAYRAYAVAANIRRHAIRHRVGDFKSLARQANGNRGGYVSERRLEFLAIISVVCIHLVSACRCGNAAR